MFKRKNQNLKYLGYLGLGALLFCALLQLNAAEKADDKEGQNSYCSQSQKELNASKKQEKLSGADYFEKNLELLQKASEALPKYLPLHLWLYPHNPD